MANLDLLHAGFDPAALLLRDLTSRQKERQDETDSDLASNPHNTLNRPTHLEVGDSKHWRREGLSAEC